MQEEVASSRVESRLVWARQTNFFQVLVVDIDGLWFFLISAFLQSLREVLVKFAKDFDESTSLKS